MIAALDSWLLSLVHSVWALPVVLLSTMSDALVPPVPSETIVVALGAVAASRGEPGFVVAIILTAAVGAWCGDVLVYLLGRGTRLSRWRIFRSPRTQQALVRARRAIDRDALGLIVSARYVPVGRVAVNLTAGSVRLRAARFLPAAGLAATVWAIYTTLLGALAGRWLDGHPLYAAAVGVVVGLLLGSLLDRLLRWWRESRARKHGREPAAPADAHEGQSLRSRTRSIE